MNYYVGDTDPPLVFDLRVDGQVPDDLAGATARIYARYENTPVLLLNSASAVLDAAAGTATYQWGVSDLAVAGDIVAWCVVTKSGGRKQTTPTVRFAIVDHDAADLAGYYTTPNRVRDEFDVDDETLDDTRAARLIRDASDLVDQLLGSYLPDATTGRKILQADVEAWQWDLLVRAATKLAAQLHTDPRGFDQQRWRSVRGPDFAFSDPLGSATSRVALQLLNQSGLRRLSGHAATRRAAATRSDLERVWWGADDC